MNTERMVNNLLTRQDAPQENDFALVAVIKGTGPDPSVLNVAVDDINGESDTGNSSQTLLNATDIFTGTAFDTIGQASCSITVAADVAGTLTLTWYRDEILNGTYSETIYVAAGVQQQIKVNHRDRFFAVTYLNGGTNQGFFSLNTTHRPVPVEDQQLPYEDFGNTSNQLSPAPLANGAVFTGSAFDAREYGSVVISVFADQASATDGLSAQWSNDGTNWNLTQTFTIPLNSGKSIELAHRARYFRIVYTNGSVTQTVFRLKCFHRRIAQLPRKGGNVANVTRVAANIAAVTLLAANSGRVSALITNYSPGNSTLYVKAGASPNIGAGTESFTAILANGGTFRVEVDEYYGPITGIWSAADALGSALITEVTRS